MGSSQSNIYTSWLGYNYNINNNNYDKYVVLPNYILRKDIINNYNNFINALDILFKIDYILPMEIYSNLSTKSYSSMGEIWKFFLQEIGDYLLYINKQKQHHFTHLNTVRGITGIGTKTVSSSGLYNVISESDKNILLEYNKFDIKLYKIARLIEKMDFKFYEFMYSESK